MSSFNGKPLELTPNSELYSRTELKIGEPSRNGSELLIEAGGGKRTFPGGVSKWQWKRTQEKKSREIERAALNRERDALESKRREQKRIIDGPEKPWENNRTK